MATRAVSFSDIFATVLLCLSLQPGTPVRRQVHEDFTERGHLDVVVLDGEFQSDACSDDNAYSNVSYDRETLVPGTKGVFEGATGGCLIVRFEGHSKPLAIERFTGQLNVLNPMAVLGHVLTERRNMDEDLIGVIRRMNALIVALVSEIHEKPRPENGTEAGPPPRARAAASEEEPQAEPPAAEAVEVAPAIAADPELAELPQAVFEGFKPKTTRHATLLLQVAMKVCDLGHMATEWDTHGRWVRRLEREFFRQGDAEKKLNRNPSFNSDRVKDSLMNGQTGFFSGFVFPLYTSLAGALPGSAVMGTYAKENFWKWKKQKPDREFLDLVEHVGPEGLDFLLGNLPLWRLNSMQLSMLSHRDQPLVALGEHILKPLVPEASHTKLISFLTDMNQHYAPAHCDEKQDQTEGDEFPNPMHVPYHNRVHATGVLHMMHVLLEHTPLPAIVKDKIFGTHLSLSHLPDDRKILLVKLTCLLAVVVHDYEHKGATNPFLKLGDIWLSDCEEGSWQEVCQTSVNEYHHITKGLDVLRQPQNDFLAEMLVDEEERSFIESGMRDIVLATDMAKDKAIVETFNDFVVRNLLA